MADPQPEERGWDWVAHSLFVQGLPAAQRCQLRVVDTVLLRSTPGSTQAEPYRWLFTSKNETVTKKKDENVTFANIRERFLRFALANPNNVAQNVCTLHYLSGGRRVLDREAFEEVMAMAEKDGGLPGVSALQCFLFPKRGTNTYKSTYTLTDNGVRAHTATLAGGAWEDLPASKAMVGAELFSATQTLVAFVEQHQHCTVSRCEAEFVLDDGGAIWLACVPALEAASTASQQVLAAIERAPSRERPAEGGAPNCDGDFCATPVGALPGLADPDATDVQPRAIDRSGQRVAISRASVLLARLQRPFLEGAAAQRAWAETDALHEQQLREQDAAAFESTVPVCPACRAVYARYERLRANGFSPPSSPQQRQQMQQDALPPTLDGAYNVATPATATRGGGGKRGKKKGKKKKAKPAPKDFMEEIEGFVAPESGPEVPPPPELASLDIAQASSRVQPGSQFGADSVMTDTEAQFMREMMQQQQQQQVQQQVQPPPSSSVDPRTEADLAEAHARVRTLEKKLASQQRDFLKMMKEKDGDHAQALLEAERRANVELESALSAQRAVHSEPAAPAGGDLLQRIDALTQELAAERSRFADERAQLAEEKRRALQEQEREHQLRMTEPRSVIQELEDKVEQLQSRMVSLVKDVTVAQNAELQARQTTRNAEGEADRLKAEVKMLNQTIASMQSMTGPSPAADSANAQAQIRQLQNKVEYLKAQLSSETTCREELRCTVTEMTEQLEAGKLERRRMVAEMEENKANDIATLEARLKQELEMPQAEVAHLQSKIAHLQAQLTDLVADVALARKKEEAARLEVVSLKQRNENASGEIQRLTTRVEDLTEQARGSRAVMEDANKSTMDALMRRLDNERKYLKMQLDSETECKMELQRALEDVRQQFATAQTDWQGKEHAAAVAATEADQRYANDTRALKTSKMALETEVHQLTQQLADTKDGYVRVREQLRAEQAQVETLKLSSTQLRQQLESSQALVEQQRKDAADAAGRHGASMEAVQNSVKEMADEKAAAVRRLESELKAKVAKLHGVQMQLLERDRDSGARDAAEQRSLGAERLGSALQRWLRVAQARAVGQWRLGAGLARAELEADGQRAAAVAAAEAAAANEAAQQLAHQRVSLEHSALDAAAEAAERFEEALGMAAADKESALAAAVLELEDRVLETAAEGAARVAAAEAAAEDRAAGVMADAEQGLQSVRELADQERAVAVAEARAAALRDADKAVLAAREEERAAAESAAEAAREERAAALARAQAEHEDALRILADEHAAAVDRAVAAAEERVSAAVDAVRAETKVDERAWVMRVHEAKAEGERRARELEAALEEARGAVAKAVADMDHARELWEKELAAKERRWQETADAAIEAAVEAATARANDIKRNAVMHEASRWQKALAEAQAKAEEDAKAAWRAGMAERDKLAAKEATDMHAEASAAVGQAQSGAKAAVDAAEARARAALEAERERLALERERAVAAAVDAARADAARERETAAAQRDADVAEARAAAEDELRRARAKVDSMQTQVTELQGQMLSSERVRVRDRERATTAETQARELGGELKALQAQMSQLVEGSREKWAAEHAKQLEEAVGKAERQGARELRQALAEAREDAVRALAEAVARAEDAARQEQEDVMQELQRESETLIGSVEQAMEQLKREKEGSERQLQETKSLLEESEDLVYDLRSELGAAQKRRSFDLLRLAASARRAAAAAAGARDDAQQQLAAAAARADEAAARVEELQQRLEAAEAELERAGEQQAEMKDTLVNHKREVLMEHKVQSAVIQQDIDALLEQKDAIEAQREQLTEEIAAMEAGVVDVEAQIREHSKSSAIANGRVNVAHAAKKKRLDAEYEAMLEGVEERRSQLLEVNDKIAELDAQRGDKEDELKDLERELVQVLVEQQKKLLTVLSSASAAGRVAQAAVRFRRSISRPQTDMPLPQTVPEENEVDFSSGAAGGMEPEPRRAATASAM